MSPDSLNGEKLRVLHCPTSTGGNPQNLAKSERLLGLRSWSLTFHASGFGYDSDETLFSSSTSIWLQQLKAWGVVLRARKNFDVIHYNSGTSILPWDVPARIYGDNFIVKAVAKMYVRICRIFETRLLCKKVIAVTYQGDDARQGDYCVKNFSICIANEVGLDYYSPDLDLRKRCRIHWFDEYADLIYALNPDLLWVLPKRAKFIPYANVNILDWTPIVKKPAAKPKVLHAPSHRHAKGTSYIIEAVNRLNVEGIMFEFILVEGKSNDEARSLYEQADLVIDQLLAGWYGGLAVEVMALGKPVISYLRRSDLVFIPPQMMEEIPIIEADPLSIYSVLREWLTVKVDDLMERGAQSRKYVEYWHDPTRIANQMKADYEFVKLNKPQLSM
jgi:hypothetical protein